ASYQTRAGYYHTVCGLGAIALGQNSRRRPASAHFRHGTSGGGFVSTKNWRVPRIRPGHWWRRILSTLPLRLERRPHHAADRRQIQKLRSTLVKERPMVWLHFDT